MNFIPLSYGLFTKIPRNLKNGHFGHWLVDIKNYFKFTLDLEKI